MRLDSNRRGFLGTASALAASLFAPGKLFSAGRTTSKAADVTGFGQSGNPYDELGVTTVINCEGTMTMLGGSILRPELEAVMAMAALQAVPPILETAIGAPITVLVAAGPLLVAGLADHRRLLAARQVVDRVAVGLHTTSERDPGREIIDDLLRVIQRMTKVAMGGILSGYIIWVAAL